MIWIALASGMAVASGVLLLLTSFKRSAPSLAGGAPELGVSVATLRDNPTEARGVRSRFGSARTSSGLSRFSLYRELESDLRVVDYGADYVVYQQIATTVAGFLFPFVMVVVILPLGGVTVPPGVAGLLCVGLAASGFYLPLQTLRQDAARRRSEFAAALSHYVSFVDVMVSGGNSIDASFEFAAELGDGWVWDEIRFAIASASSATLAPYRALQALGDELNVTELSNLSRRLEQTQQTGSAIGPALRSLADSLSKDQARHAKVADDEVTEKMTFPLMVILCSLLTFFGIAAVTAILRAAEGF